MKSSLVALLILAACSSHVPEKKVSQSTDQKTKTYRSLANAKPQSCYERIYTSEHMKKNRKQVLSSMQVSFYHDEYSKFPIVGISATTRSGMTPKRLVSGGGCYEKIGQSISCGVDADGGNFVVHLQKDSLLLTSKDGFRLEDADWKGEWDMAPMIYLEGGKDNGEYRLYKVPLHRCK